MSAAQRLVALFSSLGLVLLVVGVFSLGEQSAKAAPPYATEGTITSLTSDTERVQTGEFIELSGTWTLPDRPVGPAGLVVQLPDDLTTLVSRTFPLMSPENVEMGTCVQIRTGMNCDFDQDYLDAHPLDIHGTFKMSLQVHTEVEEERTVTYQVGDASFDLRVWTPDGGSEECTENCDFKGESASKGGEVFDDGSIYWTVKLPTPPDGQPGGSVKVTDVLGPNQTITDAFVIATDHVTLDDRYKTYELKDMARLAPSEFTVSDDLTTVEFEAKPGWYYRVIYRTQVTDELASVRYNNTVRLEMSHSSEGVVDRQLNGQAINWTGQGTGQGNPESGPSEPATTVPETASPSEDTPSGSPSTAVAGTRSDSTSTRGSASTPASGSTLPDTGAGKVTAPLVAASILILLGVALVTGTATRRQG